MSHFFDSLFGNLTALFLLVAVVIVALELTVRTLLINRLYPEIGTCPSSRIPKVIWRVLTDDRIHLFSILSKSCRRQR